MIMFIKIANEKQVKDLKHYSIILILHAVV